MQLPAISEFLWHWNELFDILRLSVPHATWKSSVEGAVRCTWPGTNLFMLTVGIASTFGRNLQLVQNDNVPVREALLILASLYLAASMGNMVDMVWDYRADQVCAPHRPLPSGMVSPLFVWQGSIVVMFASWWLANQIDSALAHYTMGALLIILFSLPFISRCHKVVSEALLALAYSTSVWVPPLVLEHFACQQAQQEQLDEDRHCLGIGELNIWPVAFLSVLFHLHREFFLDIGDVKGDREGGFRSLPVLFGETLTSYVVAAMLAVWMAVIPVLTSISPPKSQRVFFVSSAVFAVGCAISFAVVLPVRTSAQTKPRNNDDETGEDDDDKDTTMWFRDRRSRLRRLLKAELMIYVAWAVLNIVAL